MVHRTWHKIGYIVMPLIMLVVHSAYADGNISDKIPLNVGVVPLLSISGAESGNTLHYVSLNLVSASSAKLHGYGFGGFAYHNYRGLIGYQTALIYNYNRGYSYGVQSAGFLNILNGRGIGCQAAGINLCSGRFWGMQSAGLFNYQRGDMYGWQIASLFNRVTGSFIGSQNSLFSNYSGKHYGLQASLFYNRAKMINGIQIGLVNVADEMSGLPVGMLNIIKNGTLCGELSVEHDGTVTVGIQNGTRHFYSQYTAAFIPGDINFTKNAVTWEYPINFDVTSYFTWGVGCNLPVFKNVSVGTDWNFGIYFADTETMTDVYGSYPDYEDTTENEYESSMDFMSMFRISMNYRLADRLRLVTGLKYRTFNETTYGTNHEYFTGTTFYLGILTRLL